MATSFVEIAGKGFWMNDAILELWLRLLALHIEEPAESDCPAHEIRAMWLRASMGVFLGHVPVQLGAATATEQHRKVVLDGIDRLEARLVTSPDSLDCSVLNLLGFVNFPSYARSIRTSALLEVAEAFRDLVEGRIEMDASQTSLFPGGTG